MKAEQLLQHFERISEAPDAITRLRHFILDLAVRGKLVEQDPSDEPAAELLKQIAAEKARLVKVGKARKLEVDPVTNEEIPFQVPSNWVWTRLGTIGDWGSGSTPSRGNLDFYGGGITWLKSGELNDNRALTGSEETVSKLAVEKGSFRVNKPGDVLIAMYGATIGKVAMLAESAVTNQAVCGCTTFTGVLNHYLFLFLLSQRAQFHSASEGGAQPNISKVKIVWTAFPLPPLDEQHRIVARVDELMSLCDQLEAAKAELEQCRDSLAAACLQGLNQPAEEEETFREHARFTFANLPRITTRTSHIKQLRQTILRLAVRGKLLSQDPSDESAEEQLARIMEAKMLHGRRSRATKKKQAAAPDEEDDFHLPTGWATAPLADLVTVLNGRAYKQSELLDAGTPVLRVGNLFTSNKWYYSDLELDDDKYCDDGDLIFSWSASFGPFIWNGGRTIYHYHIWKLPLHSPDDLSRDYLYLYLLDKTAEIKAAGHGISMVHMTKEKMEKLEVPLPPLAEQKRIVAKVDELMAICDQLEAQITQRQQDSRRFLEAVLQEALSPATAEVS
jgi:type I restriction enzyme S subunit